MDDSWDDGFFDGVQQINISHGDAIGSFQAIYDVKGNAHPGPDHPSANNIQQAFEIKLRLPEEHIVSVRSFSSPYSSETTREVIRSLTFKTNQRTFGPYGKEEGRTFIREFKDEKLVGFKGSTGQLLYAIDFNVIKI